MANGSQNMTTYVAKQVIGSNVAANPEGALLQSGAGRADDSATGDTWLFLNTVNSATNPWGIFHSQVDNKIKIIGDGTDDFWVDMDTGDTYIYGKVGIGYDPNTSGNSYKLYVDGTTWLNDNLYLATGKHIYMNYNSTDYNVINNHSNGNISVNAAGGDGLFLGWYQTPGIFMYYTTADNSTRTKFFEVNSDGAYALTRFGVNGQNTSYTLYVNGTITATDTIYANGGYLKSTLNNNTVQIGSQNTGYCHITNSADIPFYFNKVIYSDGGFNIYNTGDNVWRNGYLKINKSDGGDCYIELRRHTNADWRIINSGGNLYFQNNWTTAKDSYFNVLQLDYNTGKVRVIKGRFFVPEWIEFNAVACGLYCPNGNGAHWWPNNVSTYGTWALKGTRGGYTGIHFGDTTGYMTIMDQGTYKGLFQEGTEWILCYRKDTAHLGIGNSDPEYKLDVSGDIRARSAWLRTTGGTGWYNESYGGGWYMTDAKWIRSFNSKPIILNIGTNNAYGIGGHRLALAMVGSSHVSWIMKGGSVIYGFCVNDNGNWYFGRRTNGQSLETTTNDAYGYYGDNVSILPNTDNAKNLGNSSKRWATIYGVKVYNAVWNDYAECRHSNELESGRCVTETSTTEGMIRTSERLMPGCKLVSDTYGTLMGETNDAKTPIAVSGRVLAYPYRAKEEYQLGAAVCSAPNGTIDMMTRDEVMMYPERIVGTVSEIPNYEVWHGGAQDGKDDIQVNGRIWIYVK